MPNEREGNPKTCSECNWSQYKEIWLDDETCESDFYYCSYEDDKMSDNIYDVIVELFNEPPEWCPLKDAEV
jgi:hypothetical protein